MPASNVAMLRAGAALDLAYADVCDAQEALDVARNAGANVCDAQEALEAARNAERAAVNAAFALLQED